MPVMMATAERRWQRTGDAIYLDLAKRWSKGTAILFAVGAVSGTVLSFELGLLWPEFMREAGSIIGMPLSLEGFAFFTEAIFLGVYLYGWDRISPRAHLAAGVLVAISGTLSGIFVVTANAWMNVPTGFDLVNGEMVNIDPVRAMLGPASLAQTLHMTLAAMVATGFAVAGIHAFLLLRQPRNAFHRRALTIALLVAVPPAIVQPFSGDLSAKIVARYQPAKLAAMEGQFATEAGAPLRIGGWPDERARRTRWALEIPGALSFLAFGDRHATVKGLDAFPESDWPAVGIVHLSFQVMVAAGTYLALLGVVIAWLALRKRDLVEQRWVMRGIVLAAPLGLLAVEAGWMVTEIGRQPWIIYNVLRTADAVTPMPGLIVPFTLFTLLYVFLGLIVAWLLYRQVLRSPRIDEPVEQPVSIPRVA
jgi:cytochrome d ubiquinol oxidase subunit I